MDGGSLLGFIWGLKCVMAQMFPETDQNVANEAEGGEGVRRKIGKLFLWVI